MGLFSDTSIKSGSFCVDWEIELDLVLTGRRKVGMETDNFSEINNSGVEDDLISHPERETVERRYYIHPERDRRRFNQVEYAYRQMERYILIQGLPFLDKPGAKTDFISLFYPIKK